MCSDHEPESPTTEAVNQARENWRTYDASVPVKVLFVVKNLGKRIFTLHTCCGNYGEPGC